MTKIKTELQEIEVYYRSLKKDFLTNSCLEMTRQREKKNVASLPRVSPLPVNKIFSTLQLSVSKSAASFAIAFSWSSSHYENSKSTSGYLCELKQILVDFLRAFNRGKFLPGS